MYKLLHSVTASELFKRQLPPFVVAFLIAELFYKFKSFALECAAFPRHVVRARRRFARLVSAPTGTFGLARMIACSEFQAPLSSCSIYRWWHSTAARFGRPW